MAEICLISVYVHCCFCSCDWFVSIIFSFCVCVCSTLFYTYLSFIVFLFVFYVLKSCASLSSILLYFMVQLRHHSLINLDLDVLHSLVIHSHIYIMKKVCACACHVAPPQQLLMSFWFTSLFCTFFSLLRCVFTSCRILCFGALLSKIGLKRNIMALRLHTDLSKRQKKQCPKNKIPCFFCFVFWHVWTLFHTFEPSVFSLNPHWCKRHWSGLYNKVMIYNMSI